MKTQPTNLTAVDSSGAQSFKRTAIIFAMLALVYLVVLGAMGFSKRHSLRTQLEPYVTLPDTHIETAGISRIGNYEGEPVVETTFTIPKNMSRADLRDWLARENSLGPWESTLTMRKTPESTSQYAAWTALRGDRTFRLVFNGVNSDVKLIINNFGAPGHMPAARIVAPKAAAPAVRSGPSSAAKTGGIHSSIGSPGPGHPKSSHTGP